MKCPEAVLDRRPPTQTQERRIWSRHPVQTRVIVEFGDRIFSASTENISPTGALIVRLPGSVRGVCSPGEDGRLGFPDLGILRARFYAARVFPDPDDARALVVAAHFPEPRIHEELEEVLRSLGSRIEPAQRYVAAERTSWVAWVVNELTRERHVRIPIPRLDLIRFGNPTDDDTVESRVLRA